MDGINPIQNRTVHSAVKNVFQCRLQFLLPRHANTVILQTMKQHRIGRLVFQRAGDYAECSERGFGFSQGGVQMIEQPLPAVAHLGNQFQRTLCPVADEHIFTNGRVTGVDRQVAAQIIRECVTQRQLVGDRQLDVDTFDTIAVVTHARQRNYHVFIQLEGVGVLRNCGRARTIQPEVLALLRADGNKALGCT